MCPAKQKIESREKKPRALHWIKVIQKAHQLSTLRGVGALRPLLLVILPPKPSTDMIADRYRSVNPARRPDPNLQHRRISNIEELVELNKMLEKVRARLRFLRSESKQHAENSSQQAGDLTSSTPTVVDDATAD